VIVLRQSLNSSILTEFIASSSTLLILNSRQVKPKPNWQGVGEADDRILNTEQSLQIAAKLLHCLTPHDTLTHGPPEETSPFLFDAIYRSTVIYMQEYSCTGSKIFLDGANGLKAGLAKLGERWQAASKSFFDWYNMCSVYY
jgi:hypothetical protein